MTSSGEPAGEGGPVAAGRLRRALARILIGLDPLAIERRLQEHRRVREQVGERLDRLEHDAAGQQRALESLQRELEQLRDERMCAAEGRLDGAEEAIRAAQQLGAGLQAEVERLRDVTIPGHAAQLSDVVTEIESLRDRKLAVLDDRARAVDERLDRLEASAAGAVTELEALRDERIPAAVARVDTLIDRLADELAELGSLVERILRGEPLPAPQAGADERELAAGLGDVQELLLERLRGSSEEIAHRLEIYLPKLTANAPVLDLGSGRGELLELLRAHGVPAIGIEGDPAVATAARRRGLEIVEGDVLDRLRDQPDESFGAVSAIHLFEHLPATILLACLAEIRRVLRPGGLLLAEAPNPHSLRVGASLFWLDPTHRRPLPPETLDLFCTASGLEVTETLALHPFPPEQRFTAEPLAAPGDGPTAELARVVDRLRARLDEIVNGARDYALIARKPDGGSA